MRVYVVQHGEAVSKEIDPDRPLSERGRTDLERLGRFLRPLKLDVARVLHSGKTRARQSAEILARTAALGVDPVETSGLGPNDPAEPFVDVINDHPEDTVIVAHMPFVTMLVTTLVTGHPGQELVTYAPGTLVCIDYTPDQHWRIAWVLPPSLLAE